MSAPDAIGAEMRAGQGDATRPAVVITGASEGIGLALACKFAEKGHSVALVARGAARLAAVAEELRASGRSDRVVVSIALDVTAATAYRELTERLAAAGLHVDVLINNAGIGLGGAFEDCDASDIDGLLTLNVAALTRMTHAAIADMRQRRRGHIINVASLGGYVPGPYQAAYYASKSYVASLSEAVAAELRGSGIRVAVVMPGPVDTRFHADMGVERAVYRLVLPSHRPEQVARSVYRGYKLGLRVIVPGVINRALVLALRIMPHPISVPLVGWLLKPRARRT